MSLTNYREISERGSNTGAGFQFEFYCGCCSNKWKSPFEPYRRAQLAGFIYKLGRYLGDRGTFFRATNAVADVGAKGARESALHAIGKIGTVEALDFLCDRLREGERPFVELASTAIRNLSNPDLLPYLRRQIEFVPAEHRAVLEDSAQHLEQRLR